MQCMQTFAHHTTKRKAPCISLNGNDINSRDVCPYRGFMYRVTLKEQHSTSSHTCCPPQEHKTPRLSLVLLRHTDTRSLTLLLLLLLPLPLPCREQLC
ncbi:hypothetical protein E2C01_042320 [Portunus trituberculatus]|uniref:Uncharacterized protein n=1 Tax=Portunus trituberculatus TaxID=210409 RepID=A0A5B7FW53_PORTR|nr:hypothetical protein [Portunus trituberculatus]